MMIFNLSVIEPWHWNWNIPGKLPQRIESIWLLLILFTMWNSLLCPNDADKQQYSLTRPHPDLESFCLVCIAPLVWRELELLTGRRSEINWDPTSTFSVSTSLSCLHSTGQINLDERNRLWGNVVYYILHMGFPISNYDWLIGALNFY